MENNNENKISVKEYLSGEKQLELTYIPFDSKLEIVSHIINGIINSVGGINTSLLRRISTEVFIGSISNIDMNIEDENGLSGFDQLCYLNKLDELKNNLGSEYAEFETILNERISDYIRIETNPAVTINAIYNQLKDIADKVLNYISDQVQDFDVDNFINNVSQIADGLNGGGNE